MNRKYSITFVAGTPMYASPFEATEFKYENGFVVFYLRNTPVASYLASLVIGIDSKPSEV